MSEYNHKTLIKKQVRKAAFTELGKTRSSFTEKLKKITIGEINLEIMCFCMQSKYGHF